MSHRKVPWSDLPEELLIPIVDRLENRHDVLHVRSVCKEWRRCISLSLLSNKKVLSTLLPHKLKTTNPPLFKVDFYGEEPPITSLTLVASSIFLIKPVFNPKLSPWLVTIEELNPGKVFLRRPLSRSDVVEIMPGDFPKLLDLSRFEVDEMGKIYSLRSDEPNHLFKEGHKVLLLADPIDCKSELTIDDYIAVVLYDTGSIAAINLGNEKVQPVFFKARKFDDIIMFKGKVYTVDRYGILYLMDKTGSDRFKMVKIVKDSLHPPDEKSNRLFESCGEIYLVRKCIVTWPRLKNKTTGIRVYKMNHEEKNWEELESIGDDRILFVAVDCCFFVRASDLIGWKGNCVVVHKQNSFRSHYGWITYVHDFDRNYHVRVKPRVDAELSIDVFDFEDCTFIPIEVNQCYSAVFWPPPQWLSTSDYSETGYLQAQQIEVREDLEGDCNENNSKLKPKVQTQMFFS